MASIDFVNVSKVYANRIRAVSNLHLRVDDGELAVLVGPSGCGKTTTLRLLAGLEDVSEGEVRIAGRRANELAPDRRDVAMIFQNHTLYPHWTVRRNLEFGLKMRRIPAAEIKRRTAEACETLELGALMERRPRELSGGERQRVALGRALAARPQVFLLDEPLSHLDAPLRGEMRAVIAALHRRLGTTMIYVTHDQVEAMTLGRRLVVMHRGQVQQEGTPLDVYRQPANLFVARFFGSPPMNLLHGEVAGDAFSFAERRWIVGGNQPRRKVWLGVRPEDIVLIGPGPSLGPARLDVVEPLGHESIGYFTLGGTRLALRLTPDNPLRAGDDVEPRLRPGAWRFFADDEAA